MVRRAGIQRADQHGRRIDSAMRPEVSIVNVLTAHFQLTDIIVRPIWGNHAGFKRGSDRQHLYD